MIAHDAIVTKSAVYDGRWPDRSASLFFPLERADSMLLSESRFDGAKRYYGPAPLRLLDSCPLRPEAVENVSFPAP